MLQQKVPGWTFSSSPDSSSKGNPSPQAWKSIRTYAHRQLHPGQEPAPWGVEIALRFTLGPPGAPRVFGSIRAHMCPLGAGCVCGEKGWARAVWMGTGLVY